MNNQFSKMTMKINVLSQIGENCITPEDGELIHQQIYTCLSNGNSIELDFTGVRIFASPFFNVAIGQLFEDFKRDMLKEHLTFVGLTGHGSRVLQRVIENADLFYSNQTYRMALKTVITQKSESY